MLNESIWHSQAKEAKKQKITIIMPDLRLRTFYLSVILLQIVMVRPGTHLVQNHEFQSITSESQFKKRESCLGLYVTRKFNLETDAKALYYSLLKLKYSPSIYMYLKHKKD